MKTTLLALCVVVLSASFLYAQAPTSYVGSTKHNLSTTGTGVTSTSTQICVYCHTPHNSLPEATSVRIWNHTLSTATYITRSGQVIGGGTVEDASLTPAADVNQGGTAMCLSCHDGSVAVSDLHNPPSDVATWTVGGSFTDVVGGGMGTGDKLQVGTAGDAYSLGLDFTIQHPFSIPVTGSYVSPRSSTGKMGNGTDSLQLYRHVGDATNWWLECRTCHDVHGKTANPTKAVGGGKSLLNKPIAGSELCITCHYTK